MKTFTIMPEGCRWYNVTAATAEMAYRGVCCFFNPSRKIAIRDAETGTTQIFTRHVDSTGRTVEIKEVQPC